MASSSTSLRSRPPPIEPVDADDEHDVDLETLRVITELISQDMEEINRSRKGKARADAPLSDEQIAFQTQHQDLNNALQYAHDHRMAKSIHDAVEADHAFLNTMRILEQAADDDRRAALALSKGQALPPPSNAQRLMEDPAFLDVAKPAEPERPEPPTARTGVAVAKAAPRARPSATPGQTRHQPEKVERVQCVSCGDLVKGTALKGPCGHSYCGACVSDLVDACTRDESLYPPRCCSQPFVIASIIPFLNTKLRNAFNIKRVELDVPAAHRIYCPSAKCSAFLGSSERAVGNNGYQVRCAQCGTTVCPRCKQPSHPGDNCTENQSANQVRELAKANQWQTCPGCHAIVELNTGCYHITCRCRSQFCYLCANIWKNCKCPQWEERHLIITAEQRVRQENVGRAEPTRLVFEQLVHRMANSLQDNHGCVRHVWKRRDGGGRCEECGHNLREFLLNCRHCHVLACVRCARNRL